MPDNKWTPPSDAKESKSAAGWTPPADAVESKKKIQTGGSALDLVRDISRSTSATSKSEAKGSSGSTGKEKADISVLDAASLSLIPGEVVETVIANRQEASKPKSDGIYTHEGSDSIYKKEGGKWYVDPSKSGSFVPISKGDTDARIAKLESGAQEYFGSDRSLYETEKPSEWNESQYAQNEKQRQFEKTTKIGEVASRAIDLPEELAVSTLRNSFSGTEADIFDFEEYGAGNKMRVTNRLTGQNMVFDLRNTNEGDNDNEKQLLKSFIDVNLRFPEYNKLYAEKSRLIEEIGSGALNPLDEQQKRERLTKVEEDLRVEDAKRRGYALENGKYTSAAVYQKRDKTTRRSNTQVMDDEVSAIDTRAMRIKTDAKEVKEYEAWLDEGLKSGSISQEEYNQRINDPLNASRKEQIQKDYEQIKKDSQDLAARADDNDRLAVGYFDAMKNRGDAGSLAIASFIKGFENTYLTLSGNDQHIDYYGDLSEILPGEITEEYAQNPDLPGWQKALMGITESLGAAIAFGPAGEATAIESIGLGQARNMIVNEGYRKTAWAITKNYLKKGMTPDQVGLFVNSYGNFREQIESDPDFKDVPEWEKVTLSAIYGLVSGKLERYGLTKSLSRNPIGKKLNAYIMSSVFKSLPKGASPDVIDQAIESQVKTLIAKGVLNIGGASIVEGSTEAAQEIADITLKSAYNEIKGKDFFETPKSIAEAFGQVSESFKLGMIGGSMMNTVTQAVQTPKKARTAVQLGLIEESIKNPEIKKIFENNLKSKVLNGEITAVAANAQIQEMRESQALLEKIPNVVEDKYESFQLLAQKQELTKEIEGKDENLTFVQREKVKEIDNRLAQISIEAMDKKSAPKVETEKATEIPQTTEFDALYEAETVPERRQTIDAVRTVNKAMEGKTKIVVHQNSADYREAINQIVGDNEIETDDNRTSGRFIPSKNEIHIDLDTASPRTIYHEAFHGKVRSLDKSSLGEIVKEMRDVTKGNEDLMKRVDAFVSQYADSEVNEETLAEMSAVMAETATKIDKTSLQKFIEFINKIATKIGLPNVLQQKASRGEVINFMNDLTESFRTGEKAADPKISRAPVMQSGEIDGETIVPTSSRKIPQERLNQINTFDRIYEQKVQTAANEKEAFDESVEELTAQIPDDILREEVIRDVNRKYGNKVRRAPKVEKVIGKKKPKMVLVDDAKGLVSQIKLEAKAAQDKKKQIKEVLTTISDSVKLMQTKGKISVRQLNSILSAMKGLNMDNKLAVDKFIDYVGNAISNAEFAEKMSNATTLRKQIKKSFKNKSNPFVSVAKGFAELNPKWVEDINEYLEVAEKVKASLRPTAVREGEIKFKREADLMEVGEYTAREQELQTEILAEDFRSKYERITGNSSDGRDVGEMRSEMLQAMDEGKVDYTDVIRQQLQDRMDEFKAVTIGENPPEIEQALQVDLDILDQKTAIRLLDALDSYIANDTTAGIRAQLAAYKGLKNAKDSSLKSARLRIAGNKRLGRFQNEQFTNLNILTERVFRGIRSGLQFRQESGVQDIVNGANRADTESTNKQNEYLKLFKKKNKNFDTAENIFERGALAFLKRQLVVGDQDAELARRKKLLEDSVKALKKGSDTERKKAELYEKVLNKLGVGTSASMEQIEAKAEKFNVEAVDHVVSMWTESYSDLSDFALGVHNIMLPQEQFYTPDRFASIKNRKTIEDQIEDETFALGAFSNSVSLDKNEAGVLMESKKPKALPKDRYVDLDFDTNMFRAYKLALTDMYTAEAIRQADAYMKTSEFQELVDGDDRAILQNAVSDYVKAKKGKVSNQKDTFDKLTQMNNFIASLGAGRALAGIGQFVNQYSTAMVNTLVNAGINTRPWEITDKKVQQFINNSGRPIANRGLDAVTTIDRAETLLEEAKVTRGIKDYTTKPLAKANVFMLKYLLQKPDVFAARTAWMAYYRKSMKEQGLEVDLDGPINDKAADYAQGMVDRNMDVSDTELRGKFFRDKNAVKGFVKQVFFPFATFALNQKNRMWNDMSVAFSGTASNQDRWSARRSLLALAAESVVYNTIRYAIGRLILEAAMESLDLDDDEKKEYIEKYGKNLGKSSMANAVRDLASPNPILDDQTIKMANRLIRWSGAGGPSEESVQAAVKKENKDRWYKYEDPMSPDEIEKLRAKMTEEEQYQFFEDDDIGFGQLGIQYDKLKETWDMYNAWSEGTYVQESKFGDSEKKLTKEGQGQMLMPFLLKLTGATVAPREADQLANRMFKIVKDKYGLTDSQASKINELKERGVTINDDALKMVKMKKGVPKAIDGIEDELRYLKTLNANQKKAYWKKVE